MSNAVVVKQNQEAVNPVALAWESYAIKFSAATGRPTLYCPELVGRILTELRSGKNLRAIASEDWCPHVDTIYRWAERHTEFSDMLALARKDQAHSFADRAIEVLENTEIVGDKADNARVNKSAWISRVYQWRACVQNKEYADKQTVTHTVDTDTAKLLLEARNRIKHLDGECKRVED